MKKLFSYRLSGIIVIIFFTGNSFAQFSKDNKLLASASTNNEAWNFPPANVTTTLHPPEALNISTKALQSFDHLFGKSQFVNWSAAGKNYLITFSLENKKYRALLNKNGFLVYSICYGTEKDMPASIRKIVKSMYYDYTINMTMQVNQQNRSIWLVFLEDSHQFLTVRIENDELEEVQQMDKIK